MGCGFGVVYCLLRLRRLLLLHCVFVVKLLLLVLLVLVVLSLVLLQLRAWGMLLGMVGAAILLESVAVSVSCHVWWPLAVLVRLWLRGVLLLADVKNVARGE